MVIPIALCVFTRGYRRVYHEFDVSRSALLGVARQALAHSLPLLLHTDTRMMATNFSTEFYLLAETESDNC